MTKNMGPADRIARGVTAVLVGISAFMGITDGWFAQWFSILLAVVAVYLAVTALLKNDPVYSWVGIDSHSHPEDEANPYGIHHQ